MRVLLMIITYKAVGKEELPPPSSSVVGLPVLTNTSRLLRPISTLRPLYCIWPDHIKKLKRSQVIVAIIAFSFITNTRSWRAPKKTRARSGLVALWVWLQGPASDWGFSKLLCFANLPSHCFPPLQPSTDLTALPQETQESSPLSPPLQVPHPPSTNESPRLSRRRPMREPEARSSGRRRPPLTCCLCW